MTIMQYAIARAYAQLLEIEKQRPLTDREQARLQQLRPIVLHFEQTETMTA